MIMNDQILKPVYEKLKQTGTSDEEIAKIIADLTQAATVALYKEALDTFSDEDLKQIEDAPDDTAANKLIVELYAQRVGTAPTELLNVFFQKFAEKFIEA